MLLIKGTFFHANKTLEHFIKNALLNTLSRSNADLKNPFFLVVNYLVDLTNILLPLKLIFLHYPGVNFIDVLCACFSYKILTPKITNPKPSFVIFDAKISAKKCAKTLMKLTTERIALWTQLCSFLESI